MIDDVWVSMGTEFFACNYAGGKRVFVGGFVIFHFGRFCVVITAGDKEEKEWKCGK